MAQVPQSTQSFGEKLQSLPKWNLYLVLIILTSAPLFAKISVPNKPREASIDFYGKLMSIPEGSRILIGSDWTNSTRGESKGSMKALLRILMRRKIKFAVYSTADTQSPQVARDTIREVNMERIARKEAPYKGFEDWVSLGYFPNTEGTDNSINNNILGAFAGKKDSPENSGPKDVFDSPVFKGVKGVQDFQLVALITASSTNTATLERIKKVPLLFMVTGVMVPENQNYYASGQIVGLVGGVKGVYDMEQLMEYGINNPGPNLIPSTKWGLVPGFPGDLNAGMGTAYYPTLHFALSLLILAILTGNIGMFLARKKTKNGEA